METKPLLQTFCFTELAFSDKKKKIQTEDGEGC